MHVRDVDSTEERLNRLRSLLVHRQAPVSRVTSNAVESTHEQLRMCRAHSLGRSLVAPRGVLFVICIARFWEGRNICQLSPRSTHHVSLFRRVSGARASGALQLMVYHKLLRLGSASEQILDKVQVNICINDMERLAEGFRTAAFVICECAAVNSLAMLPDSSSGDNVNRWPLEAGKTA